jgi:hypothetical protein
MQHRVSLTFGSLECIHWDCRNPININITYFDHPVSFPVMKSLKLLKYCHRCCASAMTGRIKIVYYFFLHLLSTEWIPANQHCYMFLHVDQFAKNNIQFCAFLFFTRCSGHRPDPQFAPSLWCFIMKSNFFSVHPRILDVITSAAGGISSCAVACRFLPFAVSKNTSC